MEKTIPTQPGSQQPPTSAGSMRPLPLPPRSPPATFGRGCRGATEPPLRPQGSRGYTLSPSPMQPPHSTCSGYKPAQPLRGPCSWHWEFFSITNCPFWGNSVLFRTSFVGEGKEEAALGRGSESPPLQSPSGCPRSSVAGSRQSEERWFPGGSHRPGLGGGQ